MAMESKQILVVDDEEDIAEIVSHYLTREDYQVQTAHSGENALLKLGQESFDLIVLDLMLPGANGLDITRFLKNDPKTSGIPIIMLTAKGEEADIVTGLELGADDYVTKPFSPRVLAARINAVLRRKEPQVAEDQVEIVVHELKVFACGQKVELTHTEFQLLLLLMEHPGWVYTRSQIVDKVKGSDYPVTDRSVDVQIVGLRKKLGECGHYIETVRGVGYRFVEAL